jgi:hypothetical protein
MASNSSWSFSGSESLSKLVIILLVGLMVITEGCARQDVSHILQRGAASAPSATRLLAVYEPWFGSADHRDVGYSTQDPQVLRRQIDEARNMGISAFVVDWYGDRRPFLDKSFALLQEVAAQKQFLVSLMYDETEDNNGEATDDAIAAFDYAYNQYIGPEAPHRGSYLLYNGRPVIFIFPKRGRTDWNKVRAHVNTWPQPPILLYKDDPSAEFPDAFDGAYPWIHPGAKGWTADGSDWGKDYLQHFYQNMKDKYPNKIAVGAAWPGFDDRHAPWGLNRYMDARCGLTFQQSMQLFHASYQPEEPPPFLLIETWNDYEEGTAVERLNFTDCKRST